MSNEQSRSNAARWILAILAALGFATILSWRTRSDANPHRLLESKAGAISDEPKADAATPPTAMASPAEAVSKEGPPRQLPAGTSSAISARAIHGNVMSPSLTVPAPPLNTTATSLKIGFIDFTSIQRQFYKTQLERERFETIRVRESQLIDGLRSRVRALRNQQGSESELLALENELREREAGMHSNLENLATTIQTGLTQEILAVISQIATEQSYDLVINSSFQTNFIPGLTAYLREPTSAGLSEAVVARLNLGHDYSASGRDQQDERNP